jgi:hypothetical protein
MPCSRRGVFTSEPFLAIQLGMISMLEQEWKMT